MLTREEINAMFPAGVYTTDVDSNVGKLIETYRQTGDGIKGELSKLDGYVNRLDGLTGEGLDLLARSYGVTPFDVEFSPTFANFSALPYDGLTSASFDSATGTITDEQNNNTNIAGVTTNNARDGYQERVREYLGYNSNDGSFTELGDVYCRYIIPESNEGSTTSILPFGALLRYQPSAQDVLFGTFASAELQNDGRELVMYLPSSNVPLTYTLTSPITSNVGEWIWWIIYDHEFGQLLIRIYHNGETAIPLITFNGISVNLNDVASNWQPRVGAFSSGGGARPSVQGVVYGGNLTFDQRRALSQAGTDASKVARAVNPLNILAMYGFPNSTWYLTGVGDTDAAIQAARDELLKERIKVKIAANRGGDVISVLNIAMAGLGFTDEGSYQVLLGDTTGRKLDGKGRLDGTRRLLGAEHLNPATILINYNDNNNNAAMRALIDDDENQSRTNTTSLANKAMMQVLEPLLSAGVGLQLKNTRLT